MKILRSLLPLLILLCIIPFGCTLKHQLVGSSTPASALKAQNPLEEIQSTLQGIGSANDKHLTSIEKSISEAAEGITTLISWITGTIAVIGIGGVAGVKYGPRIVHRASAALNGGSSEQESSS